MAELVDAQDSGSCGVTPVGVRFPPFAPSRKVNTYHTNPSFSNVYSLSRVIVGENEQKPRRQWESAGVPSQIKRQGNKIAVERLTT